MKTPQFLASSTLLLILCGLALGAPSFETELGQLTAQHEKNVAAAIEPLKRRYQTSLELLLKRAIQGNDLETATKIKQAINDLQNATSGSEVSVAKPRSRGELEKALVGTSWTFGNGGAATIKFLSPGQAQLDTKQFTWEAVDAKTIKFGTATITFSRDFNSYECPNWFGQGSMSGKRKDP